MENMDYLDIDHLKNISKLTSSGLPKRLFHYTDSCGIAGIIKSKRIWATESSNLNDQSEIQHAINYVQNCVSNLQNNQSAFDFSPDERELLKELGCIVQQENLSIYVSSFSEERDQLSQWRAYTGGKPGYCLGLSSKLLRECAEDQGFILNRCTYNHNETYKIIKEVLLNLVGLYSESAQSSNVRKQIHKQMVDAIAKYGPLLKHPSFSEEKEWRITTQHIPIEDKRIEFRSSNSNNIPYVSVNIEKCLRWKDHDDGTVVIWGPGHKVLDRCLIQALTYDEIGIGVGFSRSSSPFNLYR